MPRQAPFLEHVRCLNVTLPHALVGLRGAPAGRGLRRGYGAVNMVISIASFVLGASMLVFVYNIITSWARGPTPGNNPWRAMTIEWQVSLAAAGLQLRRDPQVVGGPYSYGPPTTCGISSKLNTGGGDETCHSIVIARHGLDPAIGPRTQLVIML